MAASFASSDWAGQLASALEHSARVRTESVTWVHGPMVWVVDADEEHGTAATALRMDVHEGSCRQVQATTVDAARVAPFTIGGSPARWKAVLGGTLSIVDAILDSKLRASGDLPTLVRHRGMLDAIAVAAGELDTSWADEQQAAETAKA
jgi:putative sterol carrier protein